MASVMDGMLGPVKDLIVFTRPKAPDPDINSVSEMQINMRHDGVGRFDSPVHGRNDACFVVHGNGISAVYLVEELFAVPDDFAVMQPPLFAT